MPLQLLDFAYRYTAGVLGDALHLSAEGYGSTGSGGGGGGGGGGAAGGGGDKSGSARSEAGGTVTLAALRLAIASRLNYQFQAALPKEFMLELAQERNRIALPKVEREFGLRLPPERYCLTGTGWGLKEGWESEGDGDGESEDGGDGGSGLEGMGMDVSGESGGGDVGATQDANEMEVTQEGEGDKGEAMVKSETDAEGDQKMVESNGGAGETGVAATVEDKDMADA